MRITIPHVVFRRRFTARGLPEPVAAFDDIEHAKAFAFDNSITVPECHLAVVFCHPVYHRLWCICLCHNGKRLPIPDGGFVWETDAYVAGYMSVRGRVSGDDEGFEHHAVDFGAWPIDGTILYDIDDGLPLTSPAPTPSPRPLPSDLGEWLAKQAGPWVDAKEGGPWSES